MIGDLVRHTGILEIVSLQVFAGAEKFVVEQSKRVLVLLTEMTAYADAFATVNDADRAPRKAAPAERSRLASILY